MTKEEIQFQIDQLRKDKIIYAVESAATTLVGVLTFISLRFLAIQLKLLPKTEILVAWVAYIIPVGFWIYMSISNFQRLKKIKELEKKL